MFPEIAPPNSNRVPDGTHMDAIAFEKLIQDSWGKVHWAHSRVLVRDGADKGWIDYMLKLRQKSEFDNLLDCIDLDSLHNPIADA